MKEYPELLSTIKQEIVKEATNCEIDTNTFCFDTYLLNSFTDKKEQGCDSKELTDPKKKEGEDNSSLNLSDYFLLKDGKIQYSKDSNRPLPRARKAEESEEAYFEFLKLYHNTCEELLQNTQDKNSCYRLTKQQIIQDLPINSNIPSRFTGIMSEQEIKASREKIKVLTKSNGK